MLDGFNIIDLAVRLPIVLLALTAHEFSHAYAAYRLGDPTAYRLGRCTLNPLKHLDPLGTICLLFAPIGWAKPVPVNPANFEDPRRGDLITSAAGPGANVAQAILFATLLRMVVLHAGGLSESLGARGDSLANALFWMCFMGVICNVGLAIFNCLPLYPLDGYHIAYQLMPTRSQQSFAQAAPAGPFIILAVVILGRAGDVNILRAVINPPTAALLDHVSGFPPELINDLLNF